MSVIVAWAVFVLCEICLVMKSIFISSACYFKGKKQKLDKAIKVKPLIKIE